LTSSLNNKNASEREITILKRGNFGHLRNLSPPSEKVKKVDLHGQKGSIQWKDAKDVLVKQKQLGEVP
jgi:hypothetical protein